MKEGKQVKSLSHSSSIDMESEKSEEVQSEGSYNSVLKLNNTINHRFELNQDEQELFKDTQNDLYKKKRSLSFDQARELWKIQLLNFSINQKKTLNDTLNTKMGSPGYHKKKKYKQLRFQSPQRSSRKSLIKDCELPKSPLRRLNHGIGHSKFNSQSNNSPVQKQQEKPQVKYILTTTRYQGMENEEYNSDDIAIMNQNSERNLLLQKCEVYWKYREDYEDMKLFLNVMRAFNTTCAIISTIFIIQKHFIMSSLNRLRNIYPKDLILICNTKELPWFLFDFVIAIIHFPPFMDTNDIILDNIDDIFVVLTAFQCYRIFTLIELLFHYSPLNSSKGRFVGSLSKTKLNASFYIKAWIKSHPMIFLPSFIFSFILIFSYLMYVIERKGYYAQCYEQIRASKVIDFKTTIWFSFISYFTVGYGDYYPMTYHGRIVNTFLILGGMTSSAIIIGLVSQHMELSMEENHVFRFIKTRRKEQARKDLAANLVVKIFQIRVLYITELKRSNILWKKVPRYKTLKTQLFQLVEKWKQINNELYHFHKIDYQQTNELLHLKSIEENLNGIVSNGLAVYEQMKNDKLQRQFDMKNSFQASRAEISRIVKEQQSNHGQSNKSSTVYLQPYARGKTAKHSDTISNPDSSYIRKSLQQVHPRMSQVVPIQIGRLDTREKIGRVPTIVKQQTSKTNKTNNQQQYNLKDRYEDDMNSYSLSSSDSERYVHANDIGPLQTQNSVAYLDAKPQRQQVKKKLSSSAVNIDQDQDDYEVKISSEQKLNIKKTKTTLNTPVGNRVQFSELKKYIMPFVREPTKSDIRDEVIQEDLEEEISTPLNNKSKKRSLKQSHTFAITMQKTDRNDNSGDSFQLQDQSSILRRGFNHSTYKKHESSVIEGTPNFVSKKNKLSTFAKFRSERSLIESVNDLKSEQAQEEKLIKFNIVKHHERGHSLIKYKESERGQNQRGRLTQVQKIYNIEIEKKVQYRKKPQNNSIFKEDLDLDEIENQDQESEYQDLSTKRRKRLNRKQYPSDVKFNSEFSFSQQLDDKISQFTNSNKKNQNSQLLSTISNSNPNAAAYKRNLKKTLRVNIPGKQQQNLLHQKQQPIQNQQLQLYGSQHSQAKFFDNSIVSHVQQQKFGSKSPIGLRKQYTEFSEQSDIKELQNIFDKANQSQQLGTQFMYSQNNQLANQIQNTLLDKSIVSQYEQNSPMKSIKSKLNQSRLQYELQTLKESMVIEKDNLEGIQDTVGRVEAQFQSLRKQVFKKLSSKNL